MMSAYKILLNTKSISLLLNERKEFKFCIVFAKTLKCNSNKIINSALSPTFLLPRYSNVLKIHRSTCKFSIHYLKVTHMTKIIYIMIFTQIHDDRGLNYGNYQFIQ